MIYTKMLAIPTMSIHAGAAEQIAKDHLSKVESLNEALNQGYKVVYETTLQNGLHVIRLELEDNS